MSSKSSIDLHTPDFGRPRATVLRGGYYDLARREELEQELRAVVPSNDISLDFIVTDVLECSCIAVIIKNAIAWKRVYPDGVVRLHNVKPFMSRILTLLQLDMVFVYR